MNIQRVKELIAKSITGECSFDERKTIAYTAAEQLHQAFMDGSVDLVCNEPGINFRFMGKSAYPFTCSKCKRRWPAGTPNAMVGDGPNGRNVYKCEAC